MEWRAAVVDDDNPKAVFMGFGNKSIFPVFKPLRLISTININYAESIVMDDLEGLDLDHKETMRQRVLKLSVDNYEGANEAILHRLVRSNLLTIFKHAVRRALAENASGSYQGVLGGTESVLKQLKEQREENTLFKAYLLPTKTTGKGKGKPNSKSAKKDIVG